MTHAPRCALTLSQVRGTGAARGTASCDELEDRRRAQGGVAHDHGDVHGAQDFELVNDDSGFKEPSVNACIVRYTR